MAEVPMSVEPNVRSSTYSVALTRVRCWYCRLNTRVVALAVPPVHETAFAVDDPDTGGDRSAVAGNPWQWAGTSAFLFYVGYLSNAVERRLHHHWPAYRPAPSDATQAVHWVNHCEHCGKLLDDHELHCEPGGAFVPTSESAAANIELVHVHEPFAAAAEGYSIDPAFLQNARKS